LMLCNDKRQGALPQTLEAPGYRFDILERAPGATRRGCPLLRRDPRIC
jgi:hypothetical protein